MFLVFAQRTFEHEAQHLARVVQRLFHIHFQRLVVDEVDGDEAVQQHEAEQKREQPDDLGKRAFSRDLVDDFAERVADQDRQQNIEHDERDADHVPSFVFDQSKFGVLFHGSSFKAHSALLNFLFLTTLFTKESKRK